MLKYFAEFIGKQLLYNIVDQLEKRFYYMCFPIKFATF